MTGGSSNRTPRRCGWAFCLCLDLSYNEKLEPVADRSGRHPLEFVTPLMERMSRFALLRP